MAVVRSDSQEFLNLLRNRIVGCIAALEGSPYPDYNIFASYNKFNAQ